MPMAITAQENRVGRVRANRAKGRRGWPTE
jgi:hypothetical protein